MTLMPLPMSLAGASGCPKGVRLLTNFLHLLEAEFLVRQLAAAEAQGDFHLHVFTQEIDRVLLFDSKIMRVNVRAELDFLDLVGVLVFARFLFPLGLFVAELCQNQQAGIPAARPED
jgi:hypothetical protein